MRAVRPWLIAFVLVVACGASPDVTDVETPQLESVDQLAAEFNADQGIPRMILLLSPT